MKRAITVGLFSALAFAAGATERWVYLSCDFWGKPMKPNSYGFFTNVAARAKAAGYNAIALDSHFDVAYKWPSSLMKRMRDAKNFCDSLGIEILPVLWDISHGAGCPGNWLESCPVNDLPYVRRGGKAVFNPEPVAVRGGPTENISVNGSSSKRVPMRIERRFSLKKGVRYVITVRARSKGVPADDRFQFYGSAEGRKGASYYKAMPYPHDGEWHDVVYPIEAKGDDDVSMYFGHWGRTGQLDVASFTVRQRGICGATRREGIPFTVKDAETGREYAEGRDYCEVPPIPFKHEGDPLGPYLELEIPAGSRIPEGGRLKVSAEIPNMFFTGKHKQYAGCMSNPEYYRHVETGARVVQNFLKPRMWFFCFDELRSANSCAACRARNLDMAHLMGDCITRLREAVRKVSPTARCCVWGDMFAPCRNAHDGYARTNGSFDGAAECLPKDMIICPWGSKKMEIESDYWAEKGFKCIAGAYYDDKTLGAMRRWRAVMKKHPTMFEGWMYATWYQDFSDLEAAMDVMKEAGL